MVGDWRAMVENEAGPGDTHIPEEYYAQQVVPGNKDPVNASMIVTFREVLSAMKRFGMTVYSSIVIFGAVGRYLGFHTMCNFRQA